MGVVLYNVIKAIVILSIVCGGCWIAAYDPIGRLINKLRKK